MAKKANSAPQKVHSTGVCFSGAFSALVLTQFIAFEFENNNLKEKILKKNLNVFLKIFDIFHYCS